jgi:hypothetical protein
MTEVVDAELLLNACEKTTKAGHTFQTSSSRHPMNGGGMTTTDHHQSLYNGAKNKCLHYLLDNVAATCVLEIVRHMPELILLNLDRDSMYESLGCLLPKLTLFWSGHIWHRNGKLSKR